MTGIDRTIDETLRERFEKSWQSDNPLGIQECLPPKIDKAYLGTLEELVHIQIEFAWKAFASLIDDKGHERHQPDSVSQFIRQFPELDDPEIVSELIKQEFYVRHQYGDSPDPSEYVSAFPEIVKDDQFFSGIKLPKRTPAPEISEKVGSVLGNYKILEELGEGGFGCVFMADQSEPIKRRVALKIIKPGMDTRAVIARFEAERQVLALLEHPNIAKVFDAGTTDTGRPYFVMELVKGISITDYCDTKNLSTRQRLELFIKVCGAIQHAHQKGIIHRDIKPSNILVADIDGEPIVKVIDFGIAKATQQQLTEKTIFTQFGQVIGTPQYMSPEQAETSILDIDTRSDVYSLGILLYELLTGSTPIPEEEIRRAAFDEMLRLIREGKTPKPSTRISQAGDAVTTIAKHRQVEPKKLGALIRGDLDWIVMKALEKDRSRRYDTVGSFADDMRRYLSNEPVSAGPPSASYRMRKFARKHKAAIATTLTIATLLLTSSIVSTVLFINANQARSDEQVARKKAEAASKLAGERLVAEQEARHAAEQAKEEAVHQAEIATEVTGFVTGDVLGQASPFDTADRNMTLRIALDNAGESVGDRFVDKPIVEAAVRQALGSTYRGLGEFSKAEEHLLRAVELREKHLGKLDDKTLESMNGLGLVYRYQSRPTDARDQLMETYQRYKQSKGADHHLTIMVQFNVGSLSIKTGRYQEAEDLLFDCYERRKELFSENDRDTLACMILLGQLYRLQTRYDEAESMYLQALDPLEKIAGRDHPDWFNSLANLATLYASTNRLDEAENTYKQVVEIQKRVLGADHVHTLTVQKGLASVLRRQGRLDESKALILKVMEGQMKIHGPDNPTPRLIDADLALIHREQGDMEGAERLLESAIEAREQLYGSTNIGTVRYRKLLAETYALQGHWDDAVSLYRIVHEQLGQTLGEDNPEVLGCGRELGKAYKALGDFKTAKPFFVRNYERRASAQGMDHEKTVKAQHDLAWFLTAAGELEEAITLYEDVIERRTRTLGREHADTLASMSNLASCLSQSAQPEDAKTLYEHVYQTRKNQIGVDHPKTYLALVGLCDALIQLEQFDSALEFCRNAVDYANKDPQRPGKIGRRKLELGYVLMRLGEFEESEAELLKGLELVKKSPGEFQSAQFDSLIDKAKQYLVRLYEEWGKPEEAAKWKD